MNKMELNLSEFEDTMATIESRYAQHVSKRVADIVIHRLVSCNISLDQLGNKDEYKLLTQTMIGTLIDRYHVLPDLRPDVYLFTYRRITKKNDLTEDEMLRCYRA